jgi:hypothetical protein
MLKSYQCSKEALMSDWRLQGQEKYLSNVTLYKVSFPEFWETAVREENEFYKKIEKGPTTYVKDPEGKWTIVEKEPIPIEEAALHWHEHCVFCWEKAMTNMEGEFYCTKDMYYWICAECFHDFKEKFNWQEKPAEALFDQGIGK